MSRVIVIECQRAALHAVIFRPHAGRVDVETVAGVPWDGEPATVGQQLGERLADFAPSHARVLVAVGRELLEWQNLSLPPCPEEDLPDVIRLQTDYHYSSAEDSTGLDYLPLTGGEETPHRVWAISLPQQQLNRLHQVLHGAGLRADRIVPLALGWPAWANRNVAGESQQAAIFVAPQGEEPSIWATVKGRVVMFRQLQLPQGNGQAFDAAVTGELRRTRLALSQEQPDAGEMTIQLLGDDPADLARLAEEISRKLQCRVEIVPQNTSVVLPDSADKVSLPAIGLALDEAAGNATRVDLLHPHRRPVKKTSRRTYALAAAAALSLAALVVWQGYRSLQAPINAAARMQAEIELLEESSEELREAEQAVAAIRDWLAGSVNLLDEIRIISTHVRPKPLTAESFPAGDDIVVSKVVLQNRQFEINALAKENTDMQPVEYRLRDGKHRVRRGKTEKSDELSAYPVSFQAIIDVSPDDVEEETEP